MASWLVWWLAILVVTTILLLGSLLFVVWHSLIVGRTASQAQEELQPLIDDIGRLSARAGDRASRLQPPTAGRNGHRR